MSGHLAKFDKKIFDELHTWWYPWKFSALKMAIGYSRVEKVDVENIDKSASSSLFLYPPSYQDFVPYSI